MSGTVENKGNLQQAIIDNIVDGVVTIDAEGVIKSFNHAAEKIFGYPVNEVLGKNVSILMPEQYGKYHNHNLSSFQATWESTILGIGREVLGMRKDGSTFPMKISVGRFKSNGQDIFVSIIRDVGEINEAERQLRQFKTTLDMTLDCVFMFSPDTLKFIYVNQGAMNQTGYSRAELENMTPVDIKPEFDEAKFQAVISPMISGVEPTINFETVHRHKDGTLIPVEIFLQYINPKDEAARFVAIVRDITARKQVEKVLIEAREQAEAASRAKSEFLAIMSHEIRTPMNGVLGMAQLLSETDLGDEQSDYIRYIKQSGQALLTIVNDVLDFSKIEAGELIMQAEAFDLEKTVCDVLCLLSLGVNEKELNLSHNISSDVPAWLIGDVGRIRQVLVNLLGNAIKFTEEGGIHVSVSCGGLSDGNADLRITIEDTGVGIASQDRDRLFAAFTQADSSLTRQFGGTGLGLAICEKLVSQMGGSIGVDSTPGKGSIFWIELLLPVAEISAAHPQDNSGDVAERVPGTLPLLSGHVLLVEDNLINQKIALAFMEKLGLTSDVANNGVEAFEMWRHNQYDLILMDCQMPVMDGYQATTRIREQESGHVPIIAFTAHALKADQQSCIDKGMNDYLAKPFTQQELYEKLCQWLKPVAQ